MIPFNRYLLIEPIEDEAEKTQSAVLVPEDYKLKSRHTRVEVLEKAQDCKIPVFSGDIVIVNGSMVEEITIGKNVYNLILENHILGRIDN